MDSKQIEIEGMKELLKENELEIGRLRKEIKNLKEEKEIRALNDRDNLIQIEKLEEANKKMKEELERYKKQFGHTMGED